MNSPAFLERLQSSGGAPALIGDADERISYAGLAARTESIATLFGARRSLVLIEIEPDIASVVAYLAALRGGHAVVLVEPRSKRATDIAERYTPDFIVRRGEITATGNTSPPLHPDLALLMPTSGSSGKDRLVRLSYSNMSANAASIVEALAITAFDRGALTLPLHYSYGLSILHSHLAAGGSTRLISCGILDPHFVASLDGCTSIPGVPYSYELYERIHLRKGLPASVRTMTSAGGALPATLQKSYAEFMQARGGRFLAMYGQTEATARMAVLPHEDALAGIAELGDSIPGGRFSLIDGTEDDGELVYSGPNVMMGYAAEPFDLARGAELDRLVTGDLAVRTPRGGLRITGRKNRFSKIAGIRVGHEDAERVLAKSGIASTVVGDDAMVVAVVPAPEQISAARQYLVETLRLPAAHAESVAIPVVPRLPSGKPDITALTRQALDQARSRAPAGDVQSAFEETFYPRPIAANDTFISLGGDSLAFVQISLALERSLGISPEGWEHMPVGELSGLHKRKDKTRVKLDTDLLLRGPAVLFIALHHATQGPYVGGAAVLLLLAGYSLARFQSNNLFAGRIRPVIAALGRVIVPYLAVLAFCAAMEGGVPWQKWLLVGNLGIGGYSPAGTFHIIYWFIEAYVQIVVGCALLFLIPAVRRAVARSPLAWGLALLALALIARGIIREAWLGDTLRVFATPAVLYVCAFGWCIYFARTAAQKIGLSLLALVMFPVADPPIHNFLQIKLAAVLTGAALLLWVPRIAVLKPLVTPALVLAAASYYIYLVHNLPPHFLFPHLAIPEWAGSVVNFITGVTLGLAMYGLQRAVVRAARARNREKEWKRPIPSPAAKPNGVRS